MHKFRKHYTRDEARQLLPLVKQWLEELSRARETIAHYGERLTKEMEGGNDLGGEMTVMLAITASRKASCASPVPGTET